jgi:hypothetical protein
MSSADFANGDAFARQLPFGSQPPYENGFQAMRFNALMTAMRELPLSANAAQIQARADGILYDVNRIFFNADTETWMKSMSPPAMKHQEGEE